jgi:ribosomal subunit interface protein
MQASIASPRFPLTQALTDAVNTGAAKLSHHAVATDAARLHVVLDRGDTGRHKVSASIQGLSHPITARASHEDMYVAIEKAFSLIDRQWRKRKTAHLSRRAHSRRPS